MNTQEAIKILKERAGYSRIERLSDKQYALYVEKFAEPDIMSPRQLIKLARAYTSEDNSNTAIKKSVKTNHHEQARAKSKQKIHHEQWDDLDTKQDVYREDIWNWD